MRGRWTALLAAAGLDDTEVRVKARLADAAATALSGLSSSEPTAAYWVPGRLELFGTHTDYAGGRTLVAALPRGFIFIGCGRRDGELRVIDAVSGERTMAEAVPSSPGAGWRRYVSVVAQRLSRNFPTATLGADVAFASDLPIAAGMSSSSALMVGLAATLIRLSGIRQAAPWRENIANRLDEAGYFACIENGRDFRGLAGDAGVGTHGGSEDHAAMLCAEPGTFTAFAFLPMRRLDIARLPEGWSCVVASSGAAAEKTGRAMGAYNQLSNGAAALLDIWNRHSTEAASLAAALATNAGAARQLQDMIDSTAVAGWSRSSLHARLQHFIQEDARIPQAVEALRRGDATCIWELSARSQSDSHALLANQIEETTVLADLALRHGAFASRSFGAGFGGSVWALVERVNEGTFARHWLDAYRVRHRHPLAAVFNASPGPAMIDLLPQQ